MTRRWTWRQANHSLLTVSTKAVEFNVDALPPTTYAQVEEISKELMQAIPQICGGTAQYKILTSEDQEFHVRAA